MKIYHQLGHNPSWNLSSYEEDSVGAGFIISPKHMPSDEISKRFPQNRSQNLIFDPQFFYPNYARGTLNLYDFHPAMAQNNPLDFDTQEFVSEHAELTAERCIKFQNSLDFSYIVIPTRAIDGMPSNYIEQCTKFTLDPFLQAASHLNTTKPLLLQLVLNDQMLKDTSYREELLNWLTGIEEIKGVYLIGSINRPAKQIQDAQYVYGLLTFIDGIVANGLDCIVGYLGIDSILWAVANPTIITIGTYFNTQIFKRDDFAEDDRQGGVNTPVRIYSPSLLQYLEKGYVESIIDFFPKAKNLDFQVTKYAVDVFQPADGTWHWKQPTVYKHNLLCLHQQLACLGNLQPKDRFNEVRIMINNALSRFEEIKSLVALDPANDERHLYMWLNGLNKYGKYKQWI